MKSLIVAAVAIHALAAGAGVNCRVEPDYGVREADKPGTAYVKVTLAADKVAAKSRPSANLAIVLDRSGSMHGAAIERAREAACEAVKRLDERDIISVVAYDDATSGGQRVATGVAAVTYSTDAAAVAASVNRNVVKERVLNENALRLEGAIRAADKGDFENAQRLIRESQAAVGDVGRSVDGMEELMQEEMDTQARNAAEFKSSNWSGSVRKRAKTRSFQLFNQQISK